jgi:sugar (pentulose or hexulose) kinase
MAQTVTLIFDIGKTNKKLFLFDEHLAEVYQEYKQFEEIEDDEGFPCEDLNSITKWILDCTHKILDNSDYEVKAINFSAYGASMVHLDENNELISPFYNYLKPFPKNLHQQFFDKYHGEANFSVITGSPSLGFLNSGLQLYYLKYAKPELFKKLHTSLHFPQYISSLLTKKLVSDYTSLGCHTGLWDFRNNQYAHWVTEEGLDKYLPSLEQTSKVFQTSLNNKMINVGIGVHDSSAALIPYIQNSSEPFVLISTGTWSICMNLFNDRELTKSELEDDCLNFLGIKGHSIKASRLFLGQELKEQAIALESHFQQKKGSYKSVPFDHSFVPLTTSEKKLLFSYHHLKPSRFGFKESRASQYELFENFYQAYHQLIHELTEIQITSLKLAIGASKIKDIYIDGGFADNELFIQMLCAKLPDFNIYSSSFALGSALGAALLVNFRMLPADFLKNNYRLKIHNSASAK